MLSVLLLVSISVHRLVGLLREGIRTEVGGRFVLKILHWFRFWFFVTVCIFGAAVSASAQSEKPNIVYVLVDNWGWGDIGVQGSTTATPKIDALAAEGMRLLNFNVENQCTPTRSAIHTGRLPIRSGTQKVPAPGEPDGLAL
jgi:hypothetical protein